MGSDLHINPPAPDMYRGKWEDDVLIIQRYRDCIYQDGGQWREVWRGHEEIVRMQETQLLFKAFKFTPPVNPSSKDAIAEENFRALRAQVNEAESQIQKKFDSFKDSKTGIGRVSNVDKATNEIIKLFITALKTQS